MKSAGNGGILKGRLQVLHVPVLLVVPLGASHMAQLGIDQHQSGVSVREVPHHTGAAADLPFSLSMTLLVRIRVQCSLGSCYI